MNNITIIWIYILWNYIIYENVVLLLQIEKWAFNSRTVFITYDNIAKLMASKTFIVLKHPQGRALLLHVFFEMYSPIFFNYNNVQKYKSIILAICKSSIMMLATDEIKRLRSPVQIFQLWPYHQAHIFLLINNIWAFI